MALSSGSFHRPGVEASGLRVPLKGYYKGSFKGIRKGSIKGFGVLGFRGLGLWGLGFKVGVRALGLGLFGFREV